MKILAYVVPIIVATVIFAGCAALRDLIAPRSGFSQHDSDTTYYEANGGSK